MSFVSRATILQASIDLFTGVIDPLLKTWPQDYFHPIGFGIAELLSGGRSLGRAIVMDDEMDDEQIDLECLSAAVAKRRRTLSFGDFSSRGVIRRPARAW